MVSAESLVEDLDVQRLVIDHQQLGQRRLSGVQTSLSGAGSFWAIR
jgi:hypothetical protein